MKVATREEIREIDRASVEEHGISESVLMENAGRAVCVAAMRKFPRAQHIAVVCGGGNNGGDGFVAARHLAAKGKDVTVYTAKEKSAYTGRPLENLRAAAGSGITITELAGDPSKIAPCDLIVDALLGTGAQGEVREADARLIEFINNADAGCLSVDIPSGVHSNTGAVPGAAVRADATVTFVMPKIGTAIYPGAEYAGEIFVAGITTPRHLEEKINCEIATYETCAELLRSRPADSHKGTYGHTLILAGGVGKSGAAILATDAAVRAGSGLVTLGVPQSIHGVAEQKTAEAMTEPLADTGGHFGECSADRALEIMDGKNALVTGPGISALEETAGFLRRILAGRKMPAVIDADGLNIIAQNPDIKKQAAGVVLTPHPAEMARLCGKTTAQIQADRIGAARDFARETGTFVVLKGARTVTATPEGKVFINPTGNPAMASGGMGDVLAGVIGGLLAQGYPPQDACVLGVFAHGLAGDMCAEKTGGMAVRAGEVCAALPAAFMQIKNPPEKRFFTVI